MINNPKDIQEILTALDNTTKEQLDEAIKNVDKEWSEMKMEEDIKVLEELCNNFRFEQRQILTDGDYTEFIDIEHIQAIENLIKEYKELEEGNKKWKEVYDEDQEHITELNNKIFSLEEKSKELEEHSDDLLSQNEMFKDMYDEEVYKNKKLEKENARLKAHKNGCPALPTTGVECEFKKELEETNKVEQPEDNMFICTKNEGCKLE